MRYREIFDEQICHAMAFRGCFVFGFEEGGAGGGRRAQVLSYSLHVAAIV